MKPKVVYVGSIRPRVSPGKKLLRISAPHKLRRERERDERGFKDPAVGARERECLLTD